MKRSHAAQRVLQDVIRERKRARQDEEPEQKQPASPEKESEVENVAKIPFTPLASYVTPKLRSTERDPVQVLEILCKDFEDETEHYIKLLERCASADVSWGTMRDFYLINMAGSQTFDSISRHNLIGLMRFKISRGKWRPKLLNLVKENKDADVERITSEAFALLDDGPSEKTVLASLKKLCELRGVGPATASLILGLRDRSVPFLSDEAADFFDCLGPVKYTAPYFMNYRRAMLMFREESGTDLTCVQLERRIWAQKRQEA